MTTAAATSVLTLSPSALAADQGALVVSLHDVAAITRPLIDRQLRDLTRCGVDRCSLLVVPNYHHTRALSEDDEFVRWLRHLKAQGHEIVIHGYFHQRERKTRESWRDKFFTRLYTEDEGEFYDIEFAEARRLICQAQEEFAQLGIAAQGFVAPAWLMSRAAERAARECEIEYTTRLGSVRDLRDGATHLSRSLVYSVRSPWRRQLSLAWNRTLFALNKHAALLRISIHPPDIEHSAIWNQILSLASAATVGRRCLTYGEWVQEQRRISGRN